MRIQPLFAAVLLTLVLAYTANAAGFRQYPGSHSDGAAASAAMKAAPAGTKVGVFATSDSFDKVLAFYKPIYKEIAMPGGPSGLTNGKQIKQAFFTLDGASSLSASKFWIKIQNPYVADLAATDVRNETVIETVQKH